MMFVSSSFMVVYDDPVILLLPIQLNYLTYFSELVGRNETLIPLLELTRISLLDELLLDLLTI
jgi:hypothetical protein